MSDEKRITRRDMELAGARIAAREGITVDEHRALVAKVQDRECERCGETFATTNVRKRVCSDSCRGKAHRERSGGAS
jgi:formylmethanofuran dehydrogenase subunit E